MGAGMAEGNVVSEQISNFIMEKFPLARKRGLKKDDRLLESGVLDSLGILDMVAFIEREFSISVTDEELIPENFQSVACLTSFVLQKNNRTANAQR
jgi:acyl carrier protein